MTKPCTNKNQSKDITCNQYCHIIKLESFALLLNYKKLKGTFKTCKT